MKNYIKPTLYSISRTLLFTFLIYNIGISNQALIFIATYLFYCCITILIGRKHALNYIYCIIILLPTILIDASVFITYPARVPLRFPFATIFPVLGYITGLLYLRPSKIYLAAIIAMVGILGYFSWVYWVPDMLYTAWTEKSFKLASPKLLRGNYFVTVNGDSVNIKDTIHTDCILYENYFVGCPACEKKYPSLKALNDTFIGKPFSTVMICGAITSFEKFKAHAEKNKYNGITFLYDKNSNVFPNGERVSPFPLEILSNKDSIISSVEGYSLEFQERYLRERIALINKLTKE